MMFDGLSVHAKLILKIVYMNFQAKPGNLYAK